MYYLCTKKKYIRSNMQNIQDENRGLGLGGTTLCAFGFLAFVLVDFTATKVHFVHFDAAIERNGIVLCVQGTNFVQHVPSGLLSDLTVTGELVRGNALLV